NGNTSGGKGARQGAEPSATALFGVSIVGAVCDRAFFLELTKYGRSQTAPTVGNPSLRLLPRAARPNLGGEFCSARENLFLQARLHRRRVLGVRRYFKIL